MSKAILSVQCRQWLEMEIVMEKLSISVQFSATLHLSHDEGAPAPGSALAL